MRRFRREHARRIGLRIGAGANRGLQGRGQERRGYSLAGHVGHDQHQPAIVNDDEIVVVATHLPAGNGDTVQSETRDHRRLVREHLHLDLARNAQLFLEHFPLHALLEQADVQQGSADLRRKDREVPHLLRTVAQPVHLLAERDIGRAQALVHHRNEQVDARGKLARFERRPGRRLRGCRAAATEAAARPRRLVLAQQFGAPYRLTDLRQRARRIARVLSIVSRVGGIQRVASRARQRRQGLVRAAAATASR
jgi:hypothetical protein